jgi:P4 family phage/plasmid primase-like protien
MPRPLDTGPTRQFIGKLVPPEEAVASKMVFEQESKNGSEMPEGRPRPHLVEYDPSVEAEQRDEIVKELGAPFQVTRSGYTINQPFFARIWGTYRLALYDQASGSFYHYIEEKGLFERLRDNEIRRLITEDIFSEAQFYGLGDVGSKITASCQRSIIELIKSDAESCQKNYFAQDKTANPVIHAANGMVCISAEEIELKEFSPDYKSRNQTPIDYNPKAKCENFLKDFLEKVLSKKDIEMLQRYCGLILIGGNRAQKLLFLLGKGGTGKGTIVRLIVRILGEANVEQLRVDKLNGRFETSRLIGKLLLNVVEAPEDFFNQPGAEIVKALCGHDVMDAERKGANEPIKFEGLFPVIVTSNEQLRVRLAGDEEAWLRRILIIEFDTARPADSEIIDNYEEILVKDEGEGIFAWMIQGAKRHWIELQQRKGFSSTPAQVERVHSLIARSKSIELFVKNVIQRDENENVSVDELFNGYVAFCVEKKWSPASERTFEKTSRHLIMEHFGKNMSHDIERNGKKSKRGYRELSLPADPDSELSGE